MENDDDSGEENDYDLKLKPDHKNRPLWACSDGRILLDNFSSPHKQAAEDFLSEIGERVYMSESVHEYKLTAESLYAAVSVGINSQTLLYVLNILSKSKLPKALVDFIHRYTDNFGKAKMVHINNKHLVESPFPEVMHKLLQDDIIQEAKISGKGIGFIVGNVTCEKGANDELLDEAAENKARAFEIYPDQTENVKKRCLPKELNYPLLEEYDFKNDNFNPDLDIELKPEAQPRPYQEKCLRNIFRNGQAHSGIIVLPRGAGKSFIGVCAASRIKKSCLCIATNTVCVDQWVSHFKSWSTIKQQQICRFTRDSKDKFHGKAGVVVTTYHMIVHGGKHSEEAKMMNKNIRNREWGLVIMDEVHNVPAHLFRKVVMGITKANCKLGLTATTMREDNLYLRFSLGPKLYDVNVVDLVCGGYIANVQCAEVRCLMTKEFFTAYWKKGNSKKKQALSVMNPNKLRACKSLIRFHEEERGDKIIVFVDNLFAVKEYAVRLRKPMICNATSHTENTAILELFKTSTNVNTVFILSKVGDKTIDSLSANVIILISSNASSNQEAQRIERILRAKGKPQDMVAGGKVECNAFFYSLFSEYTHENYFSDQRRKSLVNQGYNVEEILPPPDSGEHKLSLNEEISLLEKVLSTDDYDTDGSGILDTVV